MGRVSCEWGVLEYTLVHARAKTDKGRKLLEVRLDRYRAHPKAPRPKITIFRRSGRKTELARQDFDGTKDLRRRDLHGEAELPAGRGRRIPDYGVLIEWLP